MIFLRWSVTLLFSYHDEYTYLLRFLYRWKSLRFAQASKNNVNHNTITINTVQLQKQYNYSIKLGISIITIHCFRKKRCKYTQTSKQKHKCFPNGASENGVQETMLMRAITAQGPQQTHKFVCSAADQGQRDAPLTLC